MIGMALGLHVRCSIEDVLWNQTRTGKMSSVEQIRQLVRIAGEFGRPIASARQARDMLQLDGAMNRAGPGPPSFVQRDRPLAALAAISAR